MSTERKAPRRRFREFQNGDEWKYNKFKDVFDLLKNNTASRDDLNYEKGSVKNVHYGDVLIKFGDYIDVSKTKLPYFNCEKIVKKFASSLLQDGDIVIADTAEDATVGKCTEIQGSSGVKLVSGLHTIPCRPKVKFAPKYLGYYMNSYSYHDQLIPLMQGTKVTSISKSAIKETDMLIPKLIDEQHKIGEYLSNIDNIITHHQCKLEKLKALKKAYLTQMFPSTGECKPKLRFAGFNDEWEERKLDNSAVYIDGNYGEKYPKDNEFLDKGVPFFTSAVIGTTGTFEQNNVKFISKEKNDTLIKAQSQGGDLILTNRGASMGTVAQIPTDYGLVNIGPQLTRIRGNSNTNNLYLLALLKSPEYNKKLLSMNTGSAMNFVGLEELGKLVLKIPSITEQQKIGTFFSDIDKLITIHQRKLQKLQNLKKAYLNEMFI